MCFSLFWLDIHNIRYSKQYQKTWLGLATLKGSNHPVSFHPVRPPFIVKPDSESKYLFSSIWVIANLVLVFFYKHINNTCLNLGGRMKFQANVFLRDKN